MLSAEDVSYRLDMTQADCIITTPELAAQLDSVTRALPRRIQVAEDDDQAAR